MYLDTDTLYEKKLYTIDANFPITNVTYLYYENYIEGSKIAIKYVVDSNEN